MDHAGPKVFRSIPGVKAVKNHMVWIEPASAMTIDAAGVAANVAVGS